MIDTLERAKRELRQAFDAGKKTECPCCGQGVKKYKRKLDASHAAALTYLVHLYQRSAIPIHYLELEYPFKRGFRITTGHWSLVKLWGLAEQVRKDHPKFHLLQQLGDEDKPHTGFWIPTQAGEDFVYNRISVQQYRDTYAQRIVARYGDQVTIKDLYSEHWNWAETQGLLL